MASFERKLNAMRLCVNSAAATMQEVKNADDDTINDVESDLESALAYLKDIRRLQDQDRGDRA